MKPIFVALACLGASGCLYGVYSSRTGRPYPPNPADCQLRFDYLDQQSMFELATDYFPVGDISIYHQPHEFVWTDQVKEKLRPEACRLGGELVAFRGLTEGSAFEYPVGDFTVFRRRNRSTADR